MGSYLFVDVCFDPLRLFLVLLSAFGLKLWYFQRFEAFAGMNSGLPTAVCDIFVFS